MLLYALHASTSTALAPTPCGSHAPTLLCCFVALLSGPTRAPAPADHVVRLTSSPCSALSLTPPNLTPCPSHAARVAPHTRLLAAPISHFTLIPTPTLTPRALPLPCSQGSPPTHDSLQRPSHTSPSSHPSPPPSPLTPCPSHAPRGRPLHMTHYSARCERLTLTLAPHALPLPCSQGLPAHPAPARHLVRLTSQHPDPSWPFFVDVPAPSPGAGGGVRGACQLGAGTRRRGCSLGTGAACTRVLLDNVHAASLASLHGPLAALTQCMRPQLQGLCNV